MPDILPAIDWAADDLLQLRNKFLERYGSISNEFVFEVVAVVLLRGR
jgi:uncharacterized protein with HEPN domain